jgi:hypothetical protein
MSNKIDMLQKQLIHLEKQEQNFLNPIENTFIKKTLNPIVENIEDIIPSKLKETLNLAFYKGFQLVFEKGNTYIEKTYDKDKILFEYDLNNYAVDKAKNKRYLKRLDRQSNQSKLLNSSIAAVEGGALGLLGIGLPDIPLFIAVIIKNINEIALSYGINYDSTEEKNYLLYLICAALSKEEKQSEWNQKVDQLGQELDHNVVSEVSLLEQIKTTSGIISDAILAAKFVQGIPVVGVIGGVVNHVIIRKTGTYAGLKYKKRYLLRKLREVE